MYATLARVDKVTTNTYLRRNTPRTLAVHALSSDGHGSWHTLQRLSTQCRWGNMHPVASSTRRRWRDKTLSRRDEAAPDFVAH